jgi:glucosylceramidase
MTSIKGSTNVGKYKAISNNDEVEPLKEDATFSLWVFVPVTFSLFAMSIFLLAKSRNVCGGVEVYHTSFDGTNSLTPVHSTYISCFGEDSLRSSMVSAQVNIHKSRTKQSIIGFGGAFTEAAALNFATLPIDSQQRVLDMYWGENGAGYTLGRIPINSCDFSAASYSFDEVAGDWDLNHFDMEVEHDQVAIIPFIKRAVATSQASGRHIRLFGSPWSPPAWLKSKVNGIQSMDGSARQHGLLSSDLARGTWAKYMSKWVSAYGLQGIDIWGLTVQNEPEFAAPWEACKFNASSEASFVRDHLGPVMKQDHPDLKIMAFDHNKDHLESWTSAMFADDGSGAPQYVDGMAFHW